MLIKISTYSTDSIYVVDSATISNDLLKKKT